MFFFLAKRTKSQEKVIGQRAMPDAAPLPFPARAPLLILVSRTDEMVFISFLKLIKDYR